MELNVRTESGVAVVDVEGEVDIHGTPHLRDTLTELVKRASAKVVVNMARVNYIDSSGLGVLVGAMKEAGKTGGKLVLAGLTREVRTVFDLTRLARFFEIYDDAATALTRLS